MDQAEALRVAIDILRMPTRLGAQRKRPLPEGVAVLLEIAAGEATVQKDATLSVGCSEAVVHSAAIFFIEQILFDADSDSYRVLGARPDASRIDLRRNMALLMRWLHPDSASGDRVVLARRVSAAWESLKSPELRAEYDAAQSMRAATGAKSKGARSSKTRPGRLPREPSRPARLARKMRESAPVPGSRAPARSGFLWRLQLLLDRLQR